MDDVEREMATCKSTGETATFVRTSDGGRRPRMQDDTRYFAGDDRWEGGRGRQRGGYGGELIF